MNKIVFSFLSIFISVACLAQNIAQWRGPNRNGVFNETGLLKVWPEKGPDVLWTAKTSGNGYSSVTVNENGVYTTSRKDSVDYLDAFTLKGELKWSVPIGPAWSQSFNEARSTPAIENGKIYVISGAGQFACFNEKDGSVVWSYDAIKKYNGAVGEWGVCESPLIVDDKVIYTPAGNTTTMVALNKNTGEVVWQSESLKDTSAYVSPILVQHGGKKIILTIINKYFFGVNAETGKILWKYEYSALKPEKGMKIWPGAPKTNTNTPLFKDGEIYITGGYDHVAAKFKLSDDAEKLTFLWEDSVLDCHHGGVLLLDSYVYGSNWITNTKGNWCCIDWKTGKVMYEKNWITKGPIIAADGMLYCYEEKTGNIALVKATPEKFEIISSFKVGAGTGPHWAHPVINNGVLYVRHGDAVIAYKIK